MTPPVAAGRTRSICIVATVPVALTAFMAPHIRRLGETSRVTLVTSSNPDSWTDGGEAMAALCRSGVTFQPLTIARDVSLVDDLRALLALFQLFRRERFDIVQSITPKAGLLAMVAAWAARVPVRVHWFVGQVWATRRGVSRTILKALDSITAAAATHRLADSASQRGFLVREGVARDGQITVLAHGSVCGVDTTRFAPDVATRQAIRREHGIPDDAVVALYLGRLKREKGIPELAEAGAAAARACSKLHFLIVGPDEEGMRNLVRNRLRDTQTRLTFLDYTLRPEAFMAAADIFVLPSHREGFGATVIEAAACGIPTIGTAIYGLTDAIADGESGILVPLADVDALREAIVRLVTDDDLRRTMGLKARQRVERCFAEAQLTAALERYYAQFPTPVAEVS